MELREKWVSFIIRTIATHNELMSKLPCISLFRIFSAMFCQILFELVYSWERYHKNIKGELLIVSVTVYTTPTERKTLQITLLQNWTNERYKVVGSEAAVWSILCEYWEPETSHLSQRSKFVFISYMLLFGWEYRLSMDRRPQGRNNKRWIYDITTRTHLLNISRCKKIQLVQ